MPTQLRSCGTASGGNVEFVPNDVTLLAPLHSSSTSPLRHDPLVRVGLSFFLPIPVFLAISPLLAFGVTIGLISWTITYARTRTRRRAAELRATSGA